MELGRGNVKRSGFQFKQFFIEHSACAMKVCTDSIMLGSWIQLSPSRLRMLDIGTGSGLLAIMLAQKANNCSVITGIDIDIEAIKQANTNAKFCPWVAQLKFEHVGLQRFVAGSRFDLIVTNPPYFAVNRIANSYKTNSARIQARQTTELSHQDLLQNVGRLLAHEGIFYCVLPYDNINLFIQQAKTYGLFCSQHLQVRPNPEAPVLRSLLAFVKTETITVYSELNIYQEGREYSPEYIQLCKDYYLNF